RSNIVINMLVCLLLLFFWVNKSLANVIRLGPDRIFYLYSDSSNKMTLNKFTGISSEKLQAVDVIPSFGFSNKTYWLRTNVIASDFNNNELWLKLGPSFLDHITVYYRESTGKDKWNIKEFGDRISENDNDIVLPDYVMALPLSPVGYDIIFQIKSTSTLLFVAELSDPQYFLKNETRDAALWSFYFGIGSIVTIVSLCFAIKSHQRLFWGIFVFSLNYILVAALHGFPVWLFGTALRPVQDYLVSALSLLGYSSAIWLHCEIFKLKETMRSIYKFLTGAMYLTLLLQLSIPFGLYGKAIQLQSVIFIFIAPILIISSVRLWRQHSINLHTLIVGLMPPVYVLVIVCIMLTLNGIVPYNNYLSSAWQFTLLAHAISVIVLAGFRVRDEHRELEQKKKIAQELRIERNASFNQRQFLGMVAHEYRSPIAVMINTLENLKQQKVWALNKARFERIQRAVTRLMQLTENCLVESRLSSSSLHVEKMEVSFFDIIKAASAVVELSEHHYLVVTRNGHVVDMKHSELILFVDAELITIVVSNILDNSVKYTSKGVIKIDIVDSDGCIEISFRDEGDGIPKKQAEKIFDRFYRGEKDNKNTKGTGLGLYVSQQIVRAHGGDLYLTGEGDMAKVFIIRLLTIN
nr:sensor histidine kinase [Klebsiella variicola]